MPPQGGRKHPQQELIPIDTTNILFIFGRCVRRLGLTIVAQRVGKTRHRLRQRSMPQVQEASRRRALLAQVLPEDLNKYGMIPEFIGPHPGHHLALSRAVTKEDLVRILTEPKNALVKQYTLHVRAYEDSRARFRA